MDKNIETQIEECAIELFGKSFEFRQHQLNAIKQIVENAISKTKQTVLEAPTGSGKSVIGIIAAYVLYKLYGKKSKRD